MSPADLSDEQLGRQALDGDRDAFAELFARHERGLYNVAYRLTGDREDAADVTQEAFLRVFARLGDLSGRDVNLPAYLHRTARNLVYDRSAQRRRETPVQELAGTAGADEAMEADPQLSAVVAAQGAEVRAASARLPERHRLALALRELEDMGYEDIGRVLDVTPGAVAQLLARARMALRRELRLQQVDAERMAPACRARLGDIGALIDGELNPDRAQVLTAHLAGCPACRASRAAFEEARVTYRAWLPLPILLGLGAETARAAEARGLVRFRDGGEEGLAALRDGGIGGGLLSSRRRIAAAALAVLLILGVSTIVGVRSASDDPAAQPEVPEAEAATAPATAGAAPGTTAPASVSAPGAASGAAPVVVSPLGTARALSGAPETAAAVTTRGRTRVLPTVTAAGARVTAVPPPPATTAVAPPVVTDPPVTTGRAPREPQVPGTPGGPGTTTARRPQEPPVTTVRPPVATTPRRDPPIVVR